jgi:transposase
MNPYSEDLRKKIVEAIKHGTPKTEAACSFGVSRSSVKRYAAMAREGKSLTPKKRSAGSKPKLDVGAKRLLEADLEQRPAATLSERREENLSSHKGGRVRGGRERELIPRG